MHLSTYDIPEGDYKTFTEEEAIDNSATFYKRLERFTGLSFVLENGYPPGRGWGKWGYDLKHFRLFDLKKDYEFALTRGISIFQK